ncbi:YdeI/OmpD-associated family protein [Sulfitobacter sp. LCG007]
MGEADRRCGVWFDRLDIWQAEARALRAILLETELVEAFKWRAPVYTVDGANICNVAVTRSYCAAGFFKGVLLEDRHGLLIAPGANTRSVRMAKFTDLAAIEDARTALKAYIAEAIALERSGAKVDLPKDDFDYPDELIEAMEADAALKEAFEALTPGRQRGWVLHFAQAKQSDTRRSRIEKATPKILDGMGMHDR